MILFVCTGNTCRSVLAEGLARRWLAEQGQEGCFRVGSAGLAACPGEPASPPAVRVGREQGVDLSGHQARQFAPHLAEEADYILAMTESHKRQLLRLLPEAEEKIFALRELAAKLRPPAQSLTGGRQWDIPDPWGQSEQIYRETARQLAEIIEHLLPAIVEAGEKTDESCPGQ